MAKILILPVGVGLAHVGRSIMVAKELTKRGVEVVFGIGSEGIEIVKKEKLPYFPLPEFDRSAYDKKVKNNNPFIYSKKLIEKFILSELNLYKDLKPDIVVFDTRVTAKVSAQIAKIPSVSLQNADATAYYDFSKIKVPVFTLLTKYLPKRISSLLNKDYSNKLLQHIGPRVLPSIMVLEMLKFSPTLLRFGYRFNKDPYQLLSGDLTLLLDIPEYRPIKPLPENIKIVGPVFWQGSTKLPSWSDKIKNKKDIIYVTAGGTGDKEIFIKTLTYLQDTNFTVIATVGNTLKISEVKLSSKKLFITDFLPGDWIMRRAKLIIFPGGNCTAYQALSYGVPQICIPLHIDQEDNGNQLERLGTGIIVNPYINFNREKLLTAVRKIMVDKTYKANALKLQKVLSSYHGAETAAEEIIKFMGKIK